MNLLSTEMKHEELREKLLLRRVKNRKKYHVEHKYSFRKLKKMKKKQKEIIMTYFFFSRGL